MKRRFRTSRPAWPYRKQIKYRSDYQAIWESHIPALKGFTVEKISMAGDAPKDFVRHREFREGVRANTDRYIAKLGSKYYPIESIIEQLITRIGECFGVKIAESRLALIDGQVRFMSKYFLRRAETLTHGAEIYEFSLGKDNYAELSEEKSEAEFFSFQMTCGAIEQLFPDDHEQIIRGYVEMLTFDALIGHNDRHPYNWGVIVPLLKGGTPRFSPVFDTARALFWNKPESSVVKMLNDEQSLAAYIRKCKAPVCWERKENVGFFDLIGLLWAEFPQYREEISGFLSPGKLSDAVQMIEEEFANLMSNDRRKLIRQCLHRRQKALITAVEKNSKGAK